VSRQIIFASNGIDFDTQANASAKRFADEMKNYVA